MGCFRSKPHQQVRWVVWAGAAPWTIGYTRKQAIELFMHEVGPHHTWAKMQQAGYTVVKTQLAPVATPASPTHKEEV